MSLSYDIRSKHGADLYHPHAQRAEMRAHCLRLAGGQKRGERIAEFGRIKCRGTRPPRTGGLADLLDEDAR